MKQINNKKVKQAVNLTINEDQQKLINEYFKSHPGTTFAGLCLGALVYYIESKNSESARISAAEMFPD